MATVSLRRPAGASNFLANLNDRATVMKSGILARVLIMFKKVRVKVGFYFMALLVMRVNIRDSLDLVMKDTARRIFVVRLSGTVLKVTIRGFLPV